MDRVNVSSPVSNSNSPSLAASSPPSSPNPSESAEQPQQSDVPRKKKSSRKKRNASGNSKSSGNNNSNEAEDIAETAIIRKHKKAKHRRKQQQQEGKAAAEEGRPSKKARKQSRSGKSGTPSTQHDRESGLSAAQIAVNEQMRKALEEDQYSANGSIVDSDSDEDDHYMYRGKAVRMDRTALMAAMRKHLWMERLNGTVASSVVVSSGSTSAHMGDDDEYDEGNDTRPRSGRSKKKKKGKRHKEDDRILSPNTVGVATDIGADVLDRSTDVVVHDSAVGVMSGVDSAEDDFDRDGGSIFGQTAGSSNSTWVECDKCKKWRRLRGVVDEKKLPSKWYCSMNKNDPERARCSAPEEEYETPHTPESAADARSRKHLRVWVRRLQCNEAYEARQPTLTRGKKRAAATSSKEPYEWVRCCNPSCGKWRAILRIMDAKSSVIDRTTDGEWYCVMNTWDEKTASCAAPQENLPAIGCPLWVIQDED